MLIDILDADTAILFTQLPRRNTPVESGYLSALVRLRKCIAEEGRRQQLGWVLADEDIEMAVPASSSNTSLPVARASAATASNAAATASNPASPQPSLPHIPFESASTPSRAPTPPNASPCPLPRTPAHRPICPFPSRRLCDLSNTPGNKENSLLPPKEHLPLSIPMHEPPLPSDFVPSLLWPSDGFVPSASLPLDIFATPPSSLAAPIQLLSPLCLPASSPKPSPIILSPTSTLVGTSPDKESPTLGKRAVDAPSLSLVLNFSHFS
ncbi:hypothetical protein C8R44DRAFT_876563 [Mycena epipterygia]|nr:hypothetical protein C8R44DRAFT_876563 [Mycena epipterygia]